MRMGYCSMLKYIHGTSSTYGPLRRSSKLAIPRGNSRLKLDVPRPREPAPFSQFPTSQNKTNCLSRCIVFKSQIVALVTVMTVPYCVELLYSAYSEDPAACFTPEERRGKDDLCQSASFRQCLLGYAYIY